MKSPTETRMLEREQPSGGDLRRHHFMGKSIEVPADLTAAQLDGCACVRCGDEQST